MTTSGSIVAVYPGSFDPVTRGHEDVARRTLRVCDRLIVAVANESSQSKRHLFPVPERLEIMREVFADDPGIECVSFSGLLVDFARRMDAQFIVRGLRAVSDFEYEFQMAQMNGSSDAPQTVFLAPDVAEFFPSASLVREVPPWRRCQQLRLGPGCGTAANTLLP